MACNTYITHTDVCNKSTTMANPIAVACRFLGRCNPARRRPASQHGREDGPPAGSGRSDATHPRPADRPAGHTNFACPPTRATTSRDEHSRAATSVCERLLFVAAVRKRFPTVVWIVYPRVHSSVDCQAVAVGKRLPTDVTSVWFIPRVHSSAVGCQMAGVRKRLHYYTRYRQTASPVILISWCDVTDGSGRATATGSVGGALGAAGVSVDGHRRTPAAACGAQSTPKNTTFRPNDIRIWAAECCSLLWACTAVWTCLIYATLATRIVY